MRKALVVFAMMLTLLLCGCQAAGCANSLDSYGDTFSKAQAIAVIPAGTSEATETITDAGEIKDFVSSLDVDQWELRSLPNTASEIGSFGISQQRTVTLLQTSPDRTLYDAGTITFYDGGYVRLSVTGSSGLSVTFEVSEETASFLNGYFE